MIPAVTQSPDLPAPDPAPRSRRRPLRVVIVVLLAVIVFADIGHRLGVTLLRDDLFSGDAAQHTWWMYRFADSSLFPNDLAAKYMSLPIYSTPGYQAIFKLLGGAIDAQHLAESIAIVLALLGATLAWLVGRRIGGFAGGCAAVLVWVLSGSAQLLEGGFPRSFGLVLLLAGMLAVLSRRWGWLGVVMIVVTLLYPPVVLNLAPVIAGTLLIGWLRERKLPRGFVALCVGGVIAFAIIAIVYLRPLPPEIGRWTTYAAAQQMPEWGRLGRTVFFRPWRVFYFQSATAGIGLTLVQTVVALSAIVLTVLFSRRAIRVEAWLLLAGALLAFALAHAVAFKMYLPSRYMTYAVPTFGMMWAAGVAAAWCACGSSKAAAPRNARTISARARIAGAVFFVAVILLLTRSTSHAIAAYRGPGTWAPPAGFDQAMAVLQTLPVDTLVAAHPMDGNAIPLLSRRSVFVNHEVAIPFHDAYYAEMKRRMEATFDMLYASDWPTIDAIADRDGVDVFLLDPRRLADPAARSYREPFDTQNAAKIAHRSFAMLNSPDDRILFSSGDVILLRVGSTR